MTISEDFNDSDWEMLVFSPAFAAYGVAACDGRIDAKERESITTIMDDMRAKYPHNQLICAVLADLPAMLEEMTIPGSLRYVKTKEESLWAYRKIGQILESVPDEMEGREFKAFLVDVVEQVAHTSGKKIKVFGRDVNEEEANFLADVRNALMVG